MCTCNQTNPCNQTPNICGQTPCTPTQDCSCPVRLNTECLTYNGLDLECSGIESGLDLNQTLQLLDAYICTAIAEINDSINLINVGTGLQIYAGIDAIGRRKIRSITTTGDLLTSVQNENDITFGIDEEALSEFVQDNITIVNVGSGAEVFKGFNTTSEEYEFKSVVIDPQDGIGESFVRDIQENTNDITVRVKKIKSDTLTITANDKEISLNLAESAQIPALYVNNLYIPTYNDWVNAGGDLVTNASFLYRGEGTLAKPFTDSINYTSAVAYNITPNTAIQNALDGHPTLSYVGTGTRLAPQRVGEKIIIQDNSGVYTFLGNFSYSRINIELNANVNSTTTGYLVDMDNATYFNTLNDSATITINLGYLLGISGDGLNNSGTNVATFLEIQARTLFLLGEGRIASTVNDITKYIINSDITSTGNNNDGSLTFRIEGGIYAAYQGLVRIGGVSRVWNFGKIQSSAPNVTINPSLKAFLFLGGDFRSFQGSRLEFSGIRTDGFVFTPTGGFTPKMVGQSCTLSTLNTIRNLFNKTNNNNASLIFSNSDSSVSFLVTNIFESTNLWSVVFNRNIFETGTIDITKADLTFGNTISVSNSIGGNLIESLRIFDDREDAIANSVPLYSAYIKTSGIAYPDTTKWVRDIVLPA